VAKLLNVNLGGSQFEPRLDAYSSEIFVVVLSHCRTLHSNRLRTLLYTSLPIYYHPFVPGY